MGALCVTVLWSWHAILSVRAADGIGVSLAKQDASLRAQLKDLDEARLRAIKSTEKITKETEQAVANSQKKNSSESMADQPAKHVVIAELLKNDPQLQRVYYTVKRAEGCISYRALFKEKRLTPEQIETLIDALIKNAMDADDQRAIKEARGLANDDPALVTLRDEAVADLKTVADSVLGDGGYKQLQEYERTISVRDDVREFGGNTAIAGVPITAEQGEKLVSAMMSTVTPDADASEWDFDWVEVNKLACEILSPEQFNMYQRMNHVRPFVDMRNALDKIQEDEAEKKPQE